MAKWVVFILVVVVITSTVVVSNLPAQNPTIPTLGLKFWVKADAGITEAAGLVSAWADQSGSGTNATQPTAASQPSMEIGAIDGKPAVRFDGSDDFLTFTLPLNGLTGMTILLVSAADEDMDGGPVGVARAPIFWNETAEWGTVHLSPFQRLVKFRFGTTQVGNLPSYTRPASIGTAFSLTTSVKDGTADSATDSLYVNGTLVFSESGKRSTITGISPTGNLGRGYNDDSYFAGRIAEVLVYDRALSRSEQQRVEQYLLTKYFRGRVNQPPSVNAGPDLRVTLPGNASLSGSAADDGLPNHVLTTTWTKVSGPGDVVFTNPNLPTTTAAFQTTGTYILRLTASDGQLSTSDDTTVTVVPEGTPPGAIVVSPSVDLQSIVSSYPSGTTFYLTAGIYRLQSIAAKSSDVFIGAPGAIMSGARLLTSFSREGNYWIVTGQTQGPASTMGTCSIGSPRCAYPEDLFFDNVPLKHVGSLSEVTSGTFYFDYATDTIYFADDPTGHTVETSVLTTAIWGAANNVTVQRLIIEKYANPAGGGTIYAGDGTGWTIQDSEIRYNHGLGIRVSAGAKVLRSYIHHNGQLGISGNGSNIVIDGNEISYNNYARYDYSWEAGGTKFLSTTNLVVSNNYSHDNLGPGLWTDYNNRYVLFEYNRTSNNRVAGIFHELGFDATIRYNTITNDGVSDYGADLWYGAGIYLNASSNVEIYGNTVTNCANGIGASQPNRGTFYVKNLYVHDNMVTQNKAVAAGIVKDDNYFDNSIFTSWGNRWVNNSYRLWDVNARTFNWAGGYLNKDEWKAAGNDVTGIFQ